MKDSFAVVCWCVSWYEVKRSKCRRQHGVSDDRQRLLSWQLATVHSSDIDTHS